MKQPFSGILGVGSVYRGDLVFQGRVRIDGHLIGNIVSEDFLEIGPEGLVQGRCEVAQALVAGSFDGELIASERCTFLETADVRGEVHVPWIDIRPGCCLRATITVERDPAS